MAALDSIFWDQNGCLSSRIHFLERGEPNSFSPLDYAQALASQLRRLAKILPRGAWPLRFLRDTFDRYKLLEVMTQQAAAAGTWQVLSIYEDDFVVALDERQARSSGRERQPRSSGRGRPALDPFAFRSLVNDCQGRVIVVRPVEDLIDVPRRYLSLLPRESLQSLSVALGTPGAGLSSRFLDFAVACAAKGVTAIRVVGRGAFPQLAYSWDGYLPLDLVAERPSGYFTTIECEKPFDQMLQTYHALGCWLKEAASSCVS